MIIVRPIRESDLDGLYALAKEAAPGMTTLPPDRAALERKIALSTQSIARSVSSPGAETYLMVMEDTCSGAVVGTAGIIARLGEDEPFYSYKLNKVTHNSRILGKKVTVEILHLSNHFEGFAEVATLYLSKPYRRDGNGKLLARSRYLLMAAFRQRFPEQVMADLRGFYDESGRSPFWESVGRHFFQMNFADADRFGALNGNQFIADLMPTHPVYVNLLPAEAQAVIGRVNVDGEPALRLLEREGFAWHGHIDIFDGAQSVDAPIDDLRTVREHKRARISALAPGAEPSPRLVAAGTIETFTACITPLLADEDGSVQLPAATLDHLPVDIGDAIVHVEL